MHLRLPHKVTMIKPTKVKDTATGVGRLDYGSPISTRTVICKVDITSAVALIDEEGKLIRGLGTLFTRDRAVEVDDIFTFDGEKYRVDTSRPSYDVRGRFSHTLCVLDKDVLS